MSCQANSKGQRIGLEIKAGAAVVRVSSAAGVVESERRFGALKGAWDGHHSGWITGEGFRLDYKDDYGCLNHLELKVDAQGTAAAIDQKFAACGRGDRAAMDEQCAKIWGGR